MTEAAIIALLGFIAGLLLAISRKLQRINNQLAIIMELNAHDRNLGPDTG